MGLNLGHPYACKEPVELLQAIMSIYNCIKAELLDLDDQVSVFALLVLVLVYSRVMILKLPTSYNFNDSVL